MRKMKITTQKNPYSIDRKIIVIHLLLLALSFVIYKIFPYVPHKRDLSGLFFMIISILGGIVGLIFLAVSLQRLKHLAAPHIGTWKFILAFIYWISSSAIFIFFGLCKFFYNDPWVMIIFAIIFLSSLYFSVLRLADMRKNDWLILLGIFSALLLFFFLPNL